jgi:hypothetical protein
MAKGKRKLQAITAPAHPTGHGPITMIEELLLMIRNRMDVSRRAGMSKVRLELMPVEYAELLVDLLERETQS